MTFPWVHTLVVSFHAFVSHAHPDDSNPEARTPLPNLGTDSYLLRLFKKSLLWKLRKGTPHHWCPPQLVRPISKTYPSPIGLIVSYCHIPFSRPSVVVIQVQV